MGLDIHKAIFNGHEGYFNARTGRVKFQGKIFPNIATAIKSLK